MTYITLVLALTIAFVALVFVARDAQAPDEYNGSGSEVPFQSEDTQNPDVIEEEKEIPERSNTVKSTTVDEGTTLNMSNRGLLRVPDDVFKQTSVEVLDISHNKLEGALQAEVRHLTKLRVLDMSNNRFTGVPAEVGQLVYLEVLDLSNNPITGLPYEIGNLRNLKTLDLRGTNYATSDLEIIRKGLPSSVEIKTD
jgi:Leucine-rich repeat (LRR) protein